MPLRRDELVGFLSAAGLGEIEEYGDYTGVPFTTGAPALILVARRREGR